MTCIIVCVGVTYGVTDGAWIQTAVAVVQVHVISRQNRVGSATGKPTAFDDSALAMRQQIDAAALAADTKRDPGIARGGLERNHMGASAHGIQLALNAPKVCTSSLFDPIL